MGHSFPTEEELKGNPPKSPPVMPERRVEEGDIEVKYTRGRKKPKVIAPTDFLVGPEFAFL